MKHSAAPSAWPDKPYRGLNYFRPQDRPLLTGRDRDIVDCASLLAHPETRVLLLHGSTGCGKSSFLRAGLIPTMEEGAGYLFLKNVGADDEALFIRSTATPIDQVAHQIFRFASARFTLRTPRGVRELDVFSALEGATEWEGFLARSREPGGLARSLRRIAEIIPQTLVLIIDQCEEVLTLNPDEEGFTNRARFFGFLREVQEMRAPCRVIVALRTEFFGRFVDAIQTGVQDIGRLRQYFLAELPRAALIEAVLRPTERDPVGVYGVPFDSYGFEFAPRLADRIVDEVQNARYSGPALPVLQLVCLGLYEALNETRPATIEANDYDVNLGVEGQVISHIATAMWNIGVDLTSLPESKFVAFLNLLGSFYLMQDDGTAVARSRSLEWTHAQCAELGLGVEPHKLVAHLASPVCLVLREILRVRPDGGSERELTLGHDSVALGVERWRAIQQKVESDRKRRDDLVSQAVSDRFLAWMGSIWGMAMVAHAVHLNAPQLLEQLHELLLKVPPYGWMNDFLLAFERARSAITGASVMGIKVYTLVPLTLAGLGFLFTAVFMRLRTRRLAEIAAIDATLPKSPAPTHARGDGTP